MRKSHNFKDLTGKRFGHYTVICRAGSNKYGTALWRCKCDCGTERNLTGYTLTHGTSTNCGCQRRKDLVGKKFGRLVVIEKVGYKNNATYYKCQCKCGNSVTVIGTNLTRGMTKSCGCLRNDLTSLRSTTHGKSKTSLYNRWFRIKERCTNKNSSDYCYYGGRGITICKEWLSFDNFAKWSKENGYKDGLTIDRIDVNSNYEPSNCRWVDWETQQNNKSNNTTITYDGKTQTIAMWSKEMDMCASTLSWRKRHGWSDKECIEGKKK